MRTALAAMAGLASLLAIWTPALSDTLEVGRLNYAGYKRMQHCSAFVVDGGHLVTARHCLDVPPNGRMHFLEAYDRGDWAAHVELAPQRFRGSDGTDLAIACDARAANVGGLAIAGEPPRDGEVLEVLGYGAPRDQILQRATCPVKRTGDDGTLLLACRVSGGTSGGPVVRSRNGKRQVVGVAWASGPDVTLATRLEPGLPKKVCR
ncbi:trypsin-like serine peptidase [Ferruginivarius sediminum]|uniref:Serine protease n=1 Tax=Ferruginivarius sediminum TaxID=2661937 RepID=A0A369T8X1_9PROT|nr:serine protease [Ferruginivarius sediminum]RDD60924.1 serine protease [Ferruginivarius sediminum]